MCGRESEDPLVKRLFREERLCLVRVPRAPDELPPGSVVVTYPPDLRREPVIYPLARLVDPVPPVLERQREYSAMNIGQSTGELTISTVASIAAAMGAGLDLGKFAAALKATRSRTFALKLDGGKRHDLDVASFEGELRRARLTAEGSDLYERGTKLHVVTRILTARQVRITGTQAFATKGAADVEALGSAELNVAVNSGSVITMARAREDLVVGFQVLEIVVREDALDLRGATERIAVRGGDHLVSLNPAAIAEPETIFAAPEPISEASR